MPNPRTTLSAADAKNRFADALRQAESGELVLITRYRKPVAALLGGERLERLDRLEQMPGESEPETVESTGQDAGKDAAAPPAPPATEPTPRELRDRAAAGSLRRIEADLVRVHERLKPALRLIRANLFHPRFNAERLQATLRVGAHDYTTEFGRATGSPIHRYFTNRRLEAATRLLVDTELPIEVIARLVGFSRSESLSRAFKKRYGTRPTTYREFSGRLSPEVAADASADRPPALPRYLAGIATLAAGTGCGRCGDHLEAGTASRVFEDLAPICRRCAREQAPELAASSDAGKGG